MGHALRAAQPAVGKDVGARRKVLLSGLVQAGADHFPVRIREVWSQGAIVQGEMIPEVGTMVRLTRGLLVVAAQVTGTNGAGFELAFREAIDERLLLGTGLPDIPVSPIDPFLDDEDGEDQLPIWKH
jgi:hypothetical protein